MLPYFKKAEDWEGGADEFHGEGGPLLTSRSADKPPLCRKIIESGLEYREDVNHLPPGIGGNIGWVQQTRRGRRRQSAARTYLRPAAKRQNLSVLTGALVHRVVLDGKCAVAVEFSRGGPVERVDATREIILSAGAIGSPHVLQLSGIGDPEHCRLSSAQRMRSRASRRRDRSRPASMRKSGAKREPSTVTTGCA